MEGPPVAIRFDSNIAQLRKQLNRLEGMGGNSSKEDSSMVDPLSLNVMSMKDAKKSQQHSMMEVQVGRSTKSNQTRVTEMND